MDQQSATTPVGAPAQPSAQTPAEAPEDSQPVAPGTSTTPPGFGSRGRVRRRARFLRKARELAYRDLGGLVFNLHRFGQRNDALVIAKLNTLGHIDTELRALESALSEREPVTILREAGITACPRCAAIHSGEDRFCPNCGLSLSRNSNLLGDFQSAAPAGTAAAGATGAAAAPAAAGPQAPGSGSVPAPTAAPASGEPATAVHATTPSPTAAPQSWPTPPPAATPAAPNAPAPAPAIPPEPVVTQSFPPVEPATGAGPATAAGRSPSPPARPADSAPASEEEDQPTEIIRPPSPGS